MLKFKAKHKLRILMAVLMGMAIVIAPAKNKKKSTGTHNVHTRPQLVYDGVKEYDKPIRHTNDHYRALLGDKQDVQLPAAKRNGITPQSNNAGIKKLVSQHRLVKVPKSKYLDVQANLPYLTPEAYDMLLEIARRYQAKAKGNGALRVTSCLRTKESVSNLKKNNVNATTHSCHLYGTTFDISYRFMNASQKKSLARVLKELRNAGYIYVIHEAKMPCFHVTLRKPGKPGNESKAAKPSKKKGKNKSR